MSEIPGRRRNEGASDGEPDWVASDRAHVWHPYTQERTAPAPIPVVRAEGVYLHAADGRRILDGISSWWVNLHGHSHPDLNRALREQSERLEQVIFAGFTHEPAARLASKLSSMAPGRLSRVFFSDDGSTAVEVALKMAWQYWRNRGDDRRDLFVALEHAYHGDTFGAMAAGGAGTFHEKFQGALVPFGVRRAHAPVCHACPVGHAWPGCGVACAGDLERILDREGDRIAAVIVEPMLQGAGGMIVWPREFLVRAREATRRRGVPLIADEVLTGFGRTGKVFACEHGPVEPDILCVSKALTGGYLPLAATLSTEEIHDAFVGEDPGLTFFHGHSYTGNALACAVALESIRLLEDAVTSGWLRCLEAIFAERTARLRGIPAVKSARSIGLVAAADVVPSGQGGYLDPVGPRLRREFLARDILLRPLGNVLYFLPPLAISEAEAHRVFDAMEEVLEGLTGA